MFFSAKNRQAGLRLFLVGVVTCSILAAAAPCAWMIASSAHSCCKKGDQAPEQQHCQQQKVTSCCSVEPKPVAVVFQLDWAAVAPAPAASVQQEICIENLAPLPDVGSPPSGFLHHSVLRI